MLYMYYTTLTFFSVSSFLRTVVKLNSYGAIALEVNGGYYGDVIVLEFDHPVAVVMSADLQARYHMAFGIGPPTSDQEQRTMFNTMNYDESQPTKMSFVFDLTSCDAQRTGHNHFGGRYRRVGFVTMMKRFVSQLKRPVESDSNDGDNMDDCEGGSPRAEAKCDKKRERKSHKEGENEQYQSNQKKPRKQTTMFDFLGFPTRL